MNEIEPADIVLEYIQRINQHDVKGLCEMMPEDHTFIDSLGKRVKGREEMRKAWVAYFYLVPDYRISYSEVFQKDNSIAVFGVARGTYAVSGALLKENRWEMPIALRALVNDGLVKEWQVYADNEPVRQIMAAQSR